MARFITGFLSSIFLPNQTTGNTNNTPPTIKDRFTNFDNGAFNAHHHINQINNKSAILIIKLVIRFIVPSLHFMKPLNGGIKPPRTLRKFVSVKLV